jgi:ATP-dependent RNA helicase DeaD
VIPALIKGSRDLVALAQTGTGKTAAYGLPILQLTQPENVVPQALVLCPTRELCLQITRDLTAFSKHLRGIRILAVYGGSSIDTQLRALHRGVHIIVATPGRMNDIVRRQRVDLTQIQRVVLDEADEMMTMGFEEDLAAILGAVPDSARTLLFSATMPRSVASMASRYMDDPEEILVGRRNAGSDTVRHECYVVHARDRYEALRRILDCLPTVYGIIFCRTRLETQEVSAQLAADGYSAEALHGDLTQVQRDHAMHVFRVRERQLLVATDVASRGLDVTDLTHVINYNLPEDTDLYTHRSGRTGRAGKEGVSIVLANAREGHRLQILEATVRKQFLHKRVPTGKEVCEARLKMALAAVKDAPPDVGRLEPYWSVIEAELESMSREALIRCLVARDMDRILSHYDRAPDLNVVLPGRGARHERSGRDHRNGRPVRGEGFADQTGPDGRHAPEGAVTRVQVNVGQRNALTPKDLLSLINRATRGPMLRVGRVRIMEHASVFDVCGEDPRALLAMLSQLRFDGRSIRATVIGRSDGHARAPHGHARPGGKRSGGHGAERVHRRREGV